MLLYDHTAGEQLDGSEVVESEDVEDGELMACNQDVMSWDH